MHREKLRGVEGKFSEILTKTKIDRGTPKIKREKT